MPKPAPTPDVATLFAALGEPTRLRLVDALSDGSAQSIASLANGLPISRQALTKHLKVLEAAGVTRSRREGRETVYRIDPGGLLAAEQWIAAVSTQWDSLIDRLKTHVEAPASD
jgi:DNA-binding transcriptional ArsR family regulator